MSVELFDVVTTIGARRARTMIAPLQDGRGHAAEAQTLREQAQPQIVVFGKITVTVGVCQHHLAPHHDRRVRHRRFNKLPAYKICAALNGIQPIDVARITGVQGGIAEV
jgi:hypothetical protein